MPITAFRDFVLVADGVTKNAVGAAARFTVTVFDSPVGQGEKRETVTIPERLTKAVRALEQRQLDEDVNRQIELGQTLGDLLLPAYARQMFSASLARLPDDEGLRLRLRLADELADFPWEYAYIQEAHGEHTPSSFLALDPRISIVRHEALAIPSDWAAASTQRRVVILMASPQPYARYPQLTGLATEQGLIRQALGGIQGLDVDCRPDYARAPAGALPSATVDDLTSALRERADILHFAGHGDFAEDIGPAFGSIVGAGGIILADAQGLGVPVAADRLAEMLRHKGIRLVVLGACDTGRRDGHNVWSGVAPALLKAGIPAVVAMQFSVRDSLAAAFSAAFYRAVVAGLAIDEAVSLGRAAIRAAALAGQPDVRDWGVPVLYLRSAEDRVFSPVGAVQTQAISGDVLGGPDQQAQVYVLSATGRGTAWEGFLQANSLPYKGLSPYAAQDRVLFKGRAVETQDVVGFVREGYFVILFGPAGVGKTSLLQAGVIPSLIAEAHALVVSIADYARPIEAIRVGLLANADRLHIALPAEASLPALVGALIQGLQGGVVLVFDHCERLLESNVSDAERQAFVEELRRTVADVVPDRLRLIMAVREESVGQLRQLLEPLTTPARHYYGLQPLTALQGRAAIEEPLAQLGYLYHMSYDPALVSRQLVPDLDVLTPEMQGIQPAQLQIVCTRLFNEARTRQLPQIGSDLYNELHGVEGIMVGYLEEALKTLPEEQREPARSVLFSMAAPGKGTWVDSSRLMAEGSAGQQTQSALASLVSAGLLLSREAQGQTLFAFATARMAGDVRLLAERTGKRGYMAGDELARVWASWLASPETARPGEPRYQPRVGQLRYLAEAHDLLELQPIQALLLLRFAVQLDEPPDPWLDWLRASDERAVLVRQLEEGENAVADEHRASASELALGARLLGLDSPAQVGMARDTQRFYGAVARSAVMNPNPAGRQTCALALSVLPPHPKEVLERLRWALLDTPRGWRRQLRKAELWGLLCDADPAVKAHQTDLPPWERLGRYLWRVRRRLWRSRQRIAGLLVGGAVGGGLSLAPVRVLAALLADRPIGPHMALALYDGAILGAALTLGLMLARPLLVDRGPNAREDGAALLVAVLGTLGFGLGHLLVALMWGYAPYGAPAVGLFGFVAGLGVSLAVSRLPLTTARLHPLRWLLRVAGAACLFAVAQWLFSATRARGESLAIIWPGSSYQADLGPRLQAVLGAVRWPLPLWYDNLSLLDAALTGALFTEGTMLGISLAVRRQERLREQEIRTGE